MENCGCIESGYNVTVIFHGDKNIDCEALLLILNFPVALCVKVCFFFMFIAYIMSITLQDKRFCSSLFYERSETDVSD